MEVLFDADPDDMVWHAAFHSTLCSPLVFCVLENIISVFEAGRSIFGVIAVHLWCYSGQAQREMAEVAL